MRQDKIATWEKWAEQVRKYNECEATIRYTQARLCRVDDPDDVARLSNRLTEEFRAQAEATIEADRLKCELREIEEAGVERIAIDDRRAVPTRVQDAADTLEAAADVAAEARAFLEKHRSPEGRIDQAARALKRVPPDRLSSALVASGLFELEADGRLKPL